VDASASPNLANPCQNVGYNWDFGGISNASPPDPNDPIREGVTQDYEYAAAGVYTVKLVVSNAAGDSPPATIVISLGGTACNAPVASFTVSPAAIPNATNPTNWTYRKNNGHPGTLFTFDGNASAFMSDPACHPSWSWNLGDGTTPAPTTPSVSHRYPDLGAPTTVHVTLTVTNDGGTNAQTVDLPLVQDK
jgi:PKD repeat protein